MFSEEDRPYLEMAIQTVLTHYKSQIVDASFLEKQDVVESMAAEISFRAKQFKKITDSTVKRMEGGFL